MDTYRGPMATDKSPSVDRAGTLYHADDESLSEAVVTAAAQATGTDRPGGHEGPDEGVLPPLFEAIDPDALDALFADADGRQREGTVAFRYNDCLVTVDSAGQIFVEPEIAIGR